MPKIKKKIEMKSERVSIPCGEISLEGILHLPDGKSPYPAVIVCHPHPLYGGDMDNNVVVTICQGLVTQSIATLRFNFRGVGGSGGRFGGGVKEQDDVKAALDYLSTRHEIDTGYSFGGAVTFPVAQEDMRVKRLALVSPALNESDWEELKRYTRPKLVLLGDADTVVPYTRLKKYFTGDKQFQVIAGADHFWWGFEAEMSKRVGEFMK
jgi:alpha/beta superfamily hydrolase